MTDETNIFSYIARTPSAEAKIADRQGAAAAEGKTKAASGSAKASKPKGKTKAGAGKRAPTKSFSTKSAPVPGSSMKEESMDLGTAHPELALASPWGSPGAKPAGGTWTSGRKRKVVASYAQLDDPELFEEEGRSAKSPRHGESGLASSGKRSSPKPSAGKKASTPPPRGACGHIDDEQCVQVSRVTNEQSIVKRKPKLKLTGRREYYLGLALASIAAPV